mgnify:CR=1 FL=1
MKPSAPRFVSVFAGLAVAALAQPPAPPLAPPGGRGGAAPEAVLAGQLLAQGDKDADQKLNRAELAALAEAWFDRLDPDRVGRVRQEEFLLRFDRIASPQAAAGRRGGRGGGGSGNALGFFSATDLNRDAILTGEELKQAFEKWFPLWDTDKDGKLTAEELTKGLGSVLPRTNMSGTNGRESMDRIPGLPPVPPSPVLSPADSMATIQLDAGFKLELAASEPMIEDPIALSFDENGRAYVLEMRGYMLDIDRAKERDPIARISRLEDTDGDGRFDKSTVFLDGLILPRAIAATSGGVLYVSDYQLYFARDTDGDGKADKTELVDADYGRGNVEHAPNGLFRAMDNWIYNGESPTRYRLIQGTLVKQATEVRGQWGMTQDNYGRLLYNVNNSQLLGDFTPPNYMSRNAHHQASSGLNLFVSTDQRVFPIRMNTAVNRGYSPEVVDPKTGRTFVFASSCSPMVYRGDNFPAEFVGNAFVADPAVNMLKRNIVSDQNLTLSSRFAYEDREFLAATDERFRPVNLYNGPDGALWMVDLYRGVAQYGQFMTAYLRKETLARGLDKGVHYGRLYRIASTAKKPSAFPHLAGETSLALVARLSDANGWIRDTAQRLLVERGDRSAAPTLVQVVRSSSNPLARIHSLWTLEGLFAELPASAAPTPATADHMIKLYQADAKFAPEAPALTPDVLAACLQAVADPDPKIQVAALRVSESLTARNPANQRALLKAISALDAKTAEETLFQAALSAGNLPKPDALPLLSRIATQESEHLLIRDAVLSGLQDVELQFLQGLLADPQWAKSQPGRPAMLQALASAIVKERDPAKVETLLALVANQGADQAWRRRSLLEGIAANLPVRPLRPIALTGAPAAFDALAKSDDQPVREQSEQIKALFSWPGHESAVAKAPAARTLTPAETALVTAGATIFQQLCAACHGLTGQGTVPLGPPLLNSDWVLGSESRIIRIALQGVAGPITVNGTTYQPPNILPEMPGLAPTLNDEQIASALSYVRRSWGHEAAPISPAQVAAARSETRELTRPWAPASLLEIK